MLASPAGNSEGFDKKMENPNGTGVYDYRNPRAWGDNTFWKFRRQGGATIWKPSVVWYGYFLELPILTTPCNSYNSTNSLTHL